ncbi:hypothetical protein EVAR_79177_1 [Eumeta japonica]|uniref:Uncharacterized protein n=1 Tax=Eumeta variegata TaxID=151549 RepID=A0A4C1UT67_EUMVA|nr:hypothetical protein EVAR_79177_1 [Eumeta japonica]
MALKLKYTDEHGILHINVSPTGSAKGDRTKPAEPPKTDIDYPKFDTINNRFAQYDIFGGKYDTKPDSGEESEGGGRSLFTARYNSVEEELANTPYAFNADRRASPLLDLTIRSAADSSPSRDIEDDRFFSRSVNVQYDDGLFGPQIDLIAKSVRSDSDEEPPAFTVTQLIHAQDRYFDLSAKSGALKVNGDGGDTGSDSKSGSVRDKSTVKELTNKFEIRSAPASARDRPRRRAGKDEAFKILQPAEVKAVREIEITAHAPVSPRVWIHNGALIPTLMCGSESWVWQKNNERANWPEPMLRACDRCLVRVECLWKTDAGRCSHKARKEYFIEA